ncbi:MAG TPA: hypothetical protein VMB73_24285 [Acetobacteraceae bacterium]|nr:hypothetical protein [Acetobacteraceae bacterium]
MPDPGIDATQRIEECAILAERRRRYPTGSAVSCDRHRNTGAGLFVMTRPGIGRIRIDQGADLIE